MTAGKPLPELFHAPSFDHESFVHMLMLELDGGGLSELRHQNPDWSASYARGSTITPSTSSPTPPGLRSDLDSVSKIPQTTGKSVYRSIQDRLPTDPATTVVAGEHWNFLMDSRLIRQPVITLKQEVYAYELLFGGSPSFSMELQDNASSTSETMHEQDVAELCDFSNGLTSFVRLDRRQMEGQQYRAFPSDRFVIEIPETELPDRSLAAVCRTARQSGYRIALNDFVVEPRLQPMLDCIDLLKVDFPALTSEQHHRIIHSATQHHFETIADHTDTIADFDRAKKLGYHFFQGDFYRRPDLRNLNRLATGQTQLLRVLQAVNQSEFKVELIDQLIRQDVALSVRLLKYLNSSTFGLRSKVSSIRQAVALLGHRPLQRWVTLLSVGELCNHKPMVLMNTSLVRARFCEAVGEQALNARDASECFLMGLLSLLDAVLDQPMQEILQQLSLSKTITDTLLGQSSSMSPVLELIQCMEKGDFRRIAAIVYELQFEESYVFDEYRKACAWATDIFSRM